MCCELACCYARGLAGLHGGVYGKQSEARNAACRLHAMGIENLFAKHLHAAADACDQAGAGVVEQHAVQTLISHPEKIVDGLLAARQDHDVGLPQLCGAPAKTESHGRLRAQSVEISEIRE